ncbi:hypothetical protein PHYSODRAFT_327334 [Phytophthora sojae]|uniref:Uncharacterized protein n=1 Tax=Phytophthora sojae (strain P6497) TaxID=1094619 RepID=G4Z1Q8_PHYSP|nr:hypothetical protein PHYSODRAFT_327334 [Phytophthora sojae]EGZ26426.1 hypothetical protein PHYSODRAFT_327334 [Phytophthora sojae]|eukprot:XP_009521714.1 hypothetical protein PHYSODRAFT_327334 [Phytophthora sojae]
MEDRATSTATAPLQLPILPLDGKLHWRALRRRFGGRHHWRRGAKAMKAPVEAGPEKTLSASRSTKVTV